MWLLGAQPIRVWVEPKPLKRRQDPPHSKGGGTDGYARVGGDGGAGFWVCAADFAAEPGICGGGGADFGVGDWREHGDLYSAEPGDAAFVAGEESAAIVAAILGRPP